MDRGSKLLVTTGEHTTLIDNLPDLAGARNSRALPTVLLV
jgi:hypothetical protein